MRRTSFVTAGAFLCEIPGRLWLMYVGVLAGGMALGAWMGHREAERAFYAGQSPTLAQLRARLAVLRAIALRLTAPFRSEALAQLDAADSHVQDLAGPARKAPPRFRGPRLEHERPLGVQREPWTPDPCRWCNTLDHLTDSPAGERCRKKTLGSRQGGRPDA